MPPRKHKRPNLVHDFLISSAGFTYIINRRYSNREPLYETLDRILKQHETLTSKEDEVEKEDTELTTD